MSTLMTYFERRFDGHRAFELQSDRVLVKGREFLGAEFEQTIMLDMLRPEVNHARTRTRGFGEGITIVIAALGIKQGFGLSVFSYWGGLAIVLAVGGALLTLATSRKINWVVFKSRAGVDALTIARSGPDKEQFDAFVQKIVTQIDKAYSGQATEAGT
jgi:hypothetical protein